MEENNERYMRMPDDSDAGAVSPQPEKPEEQPEKKKKERKGLWIFLRILLILLLLINVVVGGALFAADRYLDHMLDYISYDVVEDDEYEWSGVDIDDPSYDIDDNDLGIDTSNFVDPEIGRDESDTSQEDNSNSGNSGNGSGNTGWTPPPTPPFEPDYEIIEGLFDGENISDAYDADVINILLIGADTMDGNYARSDTMILMSINNVKKRIVFTSFLRDTFVSIPGYNDNRLNAAHAAGGPRLLMQTIYHNFGIKVDYYVKVSLESFVMAVDCIGGVDITVNNDNYDYFYKHKDIQGLSKEEATNGLYKVHLGGYPALLYAQNRNYAMGDFVRTLHQRDLITQVVRSCANKSLPELHNLLKAVLPYVTTNMPKEMLKMLVWNALDYVNYSVTDARVPCADSFRFAMITGRAVIVINFDANIKYLKAKIYG